MYECFPNEFIARAGRFVMVLPCRVDVHISLSGIEPDPVKDSWNCMKSLWKTTEFNEWFQHVSIVKHIVQIKWLNLAQNAQLMHTQHWRRGSKGEFRLAAQLTYFQS